MSIRQESNELKSELDDSRNGRNEADDQEDQLKAALRQAPNSTGPQVCLASAVLTF